MHRSFVPLQFTTIFRFICAAIDIAVVPNNANIVDMHLVLLHLTITFGFICATINIAMVPNYANVWTILLCRFR